MHSLIARLLSGDRRAVARVLTLIENDAPEKRLLLKELHPYVGRAHLVGFTGSPGAGKSTLVDRSLAALRSQGLRIGVLAVDPSSPFTGGALLGDRVRMTEHSADDLVYIRSMGSRGSLGGLAKSSREMIYPLAAFGCDVIILETVGVGQAELDVLGVADTVVLVLTAGAGDSVQAAKAGIMEIADVFVVNKEDVPGSDTLVRELQLMLHEKRAFREDWQPPIVRTSATQNKGIDALWTAISGHRHHLRASGYWQTRRTRRFQEETLQHVETRLLSYLRERAADDAAWRYILENMAQDDPHAAADALLATLSDGFSAR